MSSQLNMTSIMISSICFFAGCPLWFYAVQYRRSEERFSLGLFPLFALVPLYNLVYVWLIGSLLWTVSGERTERRQVRRPTSNMSVEPS